MRETTPGTVQTVGWHHELNGCESEQTGDGEGQEACVQQPMGLAESDTAGAD